MVGLGARRLLGSLRTRVVGVTGGNPPPRHGERAVESHRLQQQLAPFGVVAGGGDELHPFHVLAQGRQRRRRDALKRDGLAHFAQALAHLAANVPGQLAEHFDQLALVLGRVTERGEFGPIERAHEARRDDVAAAQFHDVAVEHRLGPFAACHLARERERHVRVRRLLHQTQHLGHGSLGEHLQVLRLREVGAQRLGDGDAERRIVGRALEIGHDDGLVLAERALADERAHCADAHGAHHHVSEHEHCKAAHGHGTAQPRAPPGDVRARLEGQRGHGAVRRGIAAGRERWRRGVETVCRALHIRRKADDRESEEHHAH